MPTDSDAVLDKSLLDNKSLDSNIVRTRRLVSIDILRGLVIVLMALDHTRDYWGSHYFSPTDLEQTDMYWFLTRWITHFCAPIFIFLTGVSAYLYGQKCSSKADLRNYLLSRGLWLIFLEIVFINVSWQFSLNLLVLQVIWVIGISMILLAGIIYLPLSLQLFLCLPFVVFHNLLNDNVIVEYLGQWQWVWFLLHEKHWISIVDEGFGIFLLYPIIPWFAVMGLGYIVGRLYSISSRSRQFVLSVMGLSLLLVFLIFRGFNLYGEPMSWMNTNDTEGQLLTSIMSFLSVTKYPPSFLYLCVTLGGGLLLLSLLEKVNVDKSYSAWARGLIIFGRVPMFFYLLHIPLINGCAHIYSYLRYGEAVNFLHGASVFPEGYVPSLLLAYIAWLVFIALLYFPCMWYGRFKRQSKQVIWSYL